MSKEPRRNVYVGHRYVPLIMDEWDKTISYEGLSIVTYQGASYTSKKRVPVGIDILNEEYWVVTGNYNAQVEHYRQDVTKLRNDFSDYKTDIDNDLSEYKNNVNEEISLIDEKIEKVVNIITPDMTSNEIRKFLSKSGDFKFMEGT